MEAIIGLIFQAVICLGVIFAAYQLKESVKQRNENIKQRIEGHESNRREKAIELLTSWEKSNDRNARYIARRLVKELSRKQKEKIIKIKPFEISNDLLHFVKLIVCDRTIQCNKKCKSCRHIFKNKISRDDGVKIFNLSLHSVAIIRQNIVSYLNSLEYIASAYKHNIADRDILKEQFIYLIKREENFLAMLDEFDVSDSFPCIKFFITDMKPKENEGKAPLGINA